MTNLENFLSNLDTEVDTLNINLENVTDFDSLVTEIEENNGFEVEINFYGSAMEYLTENDISLKESLQLASEKGFTPENLNCEILASLLASSYAREEFDELEDEINEYFELLDTVTGLKEELEICDKIPMFEIETETGEYDIVNISLDIENEKFEANGNKNISIDIEIGEDLDSHLESLYDTYSEA